MSGFAKHTQFCKWMDEYKDEHTRDLKDRTTILEQCLGKMYRSMVVHPDCTEGSEFDDFTSLAKDVLNGTSKKEATIVIPFPDKRTCISYTEQEKST